MSAVARITESPRMAGLPRADEVARAVSANISAGRARGPESQSGERAADEATGGRLSFPTLVLTVLVILLVTVALRALVGADQPLWLDEAWTGVHALQPTLRQFSHSIYIDINAPLYYSLMWGWAALFGVSNEALRFPSLVLGILAPLLALLPSRDIDRSTRLIWCALLATWMPGLLQSQEARCYTLLFGLSIAGLILHARLIAAPTLGRACAWASVGALAILTHYYAVILFGCQGLAYLACHRGRALRTWAAALLYLPAFAWMAYHLPQLAAFAQTNWYERLAPASLPLLALYAVGPAALALPLLAARVKRSARGMARRSGEGRVAVLSWAIGAATAGTLILVTAGLLRPSFTPRYLTIFVPGLTLALAAWAARIGRDRPSAPLVFLALSLGWPLLWTIKFGAGPARALNFEVGSKHLMQQGADTVVFTWDNPSVRSLEPRKMAELGSFFFRRTGAPIETIGLSLPADRDPNVVLTEAAHGQKPGILWIYDRGVPGTSAVVHRPEIERLDPSWTCRDFGQDWIGVVTCIRSGPKPPPA